jgi:hypothetical protein
MNHFDHITARARTLGLSERETQAIVFDARAVDIASADTLLGEAYQIHRLFEFAGGGITNPTALAQEFDLRHACEQAIVNRLPIAQVRQEILAKMADLCPHIDTAPRGKATRGDGLATTGVAGDINEMARKRYSR